VDTGPPSVLQFWGRFGAAHPGGVQFLFCDGSIRTLPFRSDPFFANSVMQPLLTPNQGDVEKEDE
jgi:prepilin-type processing-associated H-X9-DG protein